MFFKNEKKQITILIISLMVVSFCISLYAILRYGDYFLIGSMEKMDNDDVKYIRSATILLEKNMLVYRNINQPTAYIMPGLPFTLAAFLKIFGIAGGITAFRIFQAVLHSLCVLLVFLIGKEILNSRVAAVACVLYVSYIPEISNTGLILTEEIFKFLLLVLVYVSVLAVRTKMMAYYLAGGLLWGLACLFRPTVALYPAVILIMWLIRRYSFKEILKYSIVTASVFVIVMSPWWIRNYMVFNQFIPLTRSSGNPFLQGTYINYDQTNIATKYPELKDEFEMDRFELDAGMKRLSADFPKRPLEYIYWYTLGKTYYAWNWPFLYKPILGISWNHVHVYHLLIVGIGLAGMALVTIRRKKHQDCLLLVFTVLFFNTIYLPFFTSSRYVYPVIPFVSILGAYFLQQAVAVSYCGIKQLSGRFYRPVGR